jgi:sucrose-6-phosphate hydrolase SacC (GH32 family)
LHFAPARELEKLRLTPRQHRDLTITNERVLDDIRGDSLDLALEVTPPASGEFIVKVRRSTDATEETAIVCDTKSGELRIDFEKNSLERATHHRGWVINQPRDPAHRDKRYTDQRAPFKLAANELLKLRLFLDRSILEVFANDRRYMIQRIFPTRPDSVGMSVASRGGESRVRSLEAWELAAANPF